MSRHTKPPYLRDGATVYALTETTEPRARQRRVNRFSAQITSGGRDGAPLDEREATAELFRAAPDLLAAHQAIVALVSGWDEDGALGPREPLSWETVARMAMDYARAALDKAGMKESRDA